MVYYYEWLTIRVLILAFFQTPEQTEVADLSGYICKHS